MDLRRIENFGNMGYHICRHLDKSFNGTTNRQVCKAKLFTYTDTYTCFLGYVYRTHAMPRNYIIIIVPSKCVLCECVQRRTQMVSITVNWGWLLLFLKNTFSTLYTRPSIIICSFCTWSILFKCICMFVCVCIQCMIQFVMKFLRTTIV